MRLFGTSLYLCRRLVYLNTFQISSQSESVSVLLIHLCLLHTKPFQSRFMEADGFTVASHAIVFRGACFPHNEKRAPPKTPTWEASFTDARGKFSGPFYLPFDNSFTRRAWIHLSRLRLVTLKTEKFRISNRRNP